MGGRKVGSSNCCRPCGRPSARLPRRLPPPLRRRPERRRSRKPLTRFIEEARLLLHDSASQLRPREIAVGGKSDPGALSDAGAERSARCTCGGPGACWRNSPATGRNAGSRKCCRPSWKSARDCRDCLHLSCYDLSAAPLPVRGATRPLSHLRRLSALFRRADTFSEHQLSNVIDVVMPLPQDKAEHPRLMKGRNKVIELFHAGRGLEGSIRGTAWGALQAFSEYADHHRHTRVPKGKSMDALRLESIWMGKAASLKRQALAAIADTARIRLAT
ncbi:DUF932 domain-containing protein [Archangium sp.]|uniref:DUF932 domain-containing protein n=1 Tax=Archangium sp. TaxID=1872627 RepID=UPI002D3230E9|nr:DUF932 domain-containing protein [Archangium sp.]HYO55919.1 DUF932 domain-containing protein [Archangium sp.]